jgi:DNA replication and repair protein RecF
LELVNFKNYEKLHQKFGSRIVCLTGKNGAGKTNILDAIAYTCIGKSYFQSTDKHCARKGADFFRIAAEFEGDLRGELVVKYRIKGGKEIEWNEDKFDRISDVVGRIPLVVIAPDDIIDFLSGSMQRRRFLDFTISQYDKQYLQDLMQYNRLLKQRNASLKSVDRPSELDKTLLFTLSRQMHALAKTIHKARSEFIETFGPELISAYARISNKAEVIECSYRSQLDEKELYELHKENFDKDAALQRTTTGIHKDDLKVKIDNEPLKIFASQGQRKSFILALKTAQYYWLYGQTKRKPILLLDDFFEKLDANRLSALVELVLDMNFGQVFITDTDADRVQHLLEEAGVNYQLLNVKNATLEEIDH